MTDMEIKGEYTPEAMKAYILYLLLNKDVLTHEEIAHQVQLDSRSVLEIIKDVKEYFLSLGISITVDKEKGLSLQTDEETKRKVLSMIIDDNPTIMNDYFDSVLKEEVHFSLMNYYLANELDISSEKIKTLENKILISHYRTTNHNDLNLEEGWDKVLPISSYQKYYQIFVAIKERCHLNLTDQDIVLLIRYVLLHRPSLMKDMVSYEKVDAVVSMTLEAIYQQISLDFRKDEIMKESLKQHIKSLIIAQFTKEYTSNPLLKQIKKQYPLSFDLARYAKPILEAELPVLLSDDELGFLALHFEVGMHRYMHKHLHAILIGQKDDPKTILLKKTIDDEVYSILRIDDIVEFNDMDTTSLVTKHLVIDPTKSYVNSKIDIVTLEYLPSIKQLEVFKETINDYYHKTLPTFTDVEIKQETVENDDIQHYLQSLTYTNRKDSRYGFDYVVKVVDDSITENEMICVKANQSFMIQDDPYTSLMIVKMKADQNSIVSGYHSLKKWINRK